MGVQTGSAIYICVRVCMCVSIFCYSFQWKQQTENSCTLSSDEINNNDHIVVPRIYNTSNRLNHPQGSSEFWEVHQPNVCRDDLIADGIKFSSKFNMYQASESRVCLSTLVVHLSHRSISEQSYARTTTLGTDR